MADGAGRVDADEVARLLVGIGKAPVAVDGEKGVADALQHAVERRFGTFQRGARLLLAGDVARDDEGALVRFRPAGGDRLLDLAAVPAPRAHHDVGARHIPGPQAVLDMERLRVLLRMDQVIEMQADELARFVAEQGARRGVGAQHAPVRVEHDHQVERIIDQGRILFGERGQPVRRGGGIIQGSQECRGAAAAGGMRACWPRAEYNHFRTETASQERNYDTRLYNFQRAAARGLFNRYRGRGRVQRRRRGPRRLAPRARRGWPRSRARTSHAAPRARGAPSRRTARGPCNRGRPRARS